MNTTHSSLPLEPSASGMEGYLSSHTIPTDFNWNADSDSSSPLPEQIPAEPSPKQILQAELFSECLRDGLHGVVCYPPIEKLLCYVDSFHSFGITSAMVGVFSGDKSTISDHIRSILTYMRDHALDITPTVLSLCTPASLKWVLECKNIHPNLEVCLFMGSAPSRRLVQGWELDFILRRLAQYVSEAVKLGIPVMGATEHTTQTPPSDLIRLVRVQIEHGAYRFCIADTIGTTRPCGAYRIVHFVRQLLDDMGASNVKLDWHGHRDTGNAIASAIMALAAGAQRIHVVSRGIGERSGNTQLEDLVLNLHNILEEAGMISPWKLNQLTQLLALYEEIVGVATPEHGVMARRYNHTTLGIHTDAILKANKLANEAHQNGESRHGTKAAPADAHDLFRRRSTKGRRTMLCGGKSMERS